MLVYLKYFWFCYKQTGPFFCLTSFFGFFTFLSLLSMKFGASFLFQLKNERLWLQSDTASKKAYPNWASIQHRPLWNQLNLGLLRAFFCYVFPFLFFSTCVSFSSFWMNMKFVTFLILFWFLHLVWRGFIWHSYLIFPSSLSSADDYSVCLYPSRQQKRPFQDFQLPTLYVVL